VIGTGVYVDTTNVYEEHYACFSGNDNNIDGEDSYGIQNDAENVVLKNLTIGWAEDGNLDFSVAGEGNCSIIDCLHLESLAIDVAGSLLISHTATQNGAIMMLRCWGHWSTSRMPQVQENNDIHLLNNLVFSGAANGSRIEFLLSGAAAGAGRTNIVGNDMREHASPPVTGRFFLGDGLQVGTEIYEIDNLAVFMGGPAGHEQFQMGDNPTSYFVGSPTAGGLPANVTILAGADVYARVRNNGGAWPSRRGETSAHNTIVNRCVAEADALAGGPQRTTIIGHPEWDGASGLVNESSATHDPRDDTGWPASPSAINADGYSEAERHYFLRY